MLKSPVCVDANIVVMIVAPEALRPQAIALWNSWLEQDREIVAPRLLAYEVTSALWRKVVRGLFTAEEGQRALRTALEMGVTFTDPPALSQRAFELAARFRRPAAYDAHYLALADHLECPFWTADERLYNGVHADFPRVRWLGDYRAGG